MVRSAGLIFVITVLLTSGKSKMSLNVIEDPSKEGRAQDFIRDAESLGTLKTRQRPDATSQDPS